VFLRMDGSKGIRAVEAHRPVNTLPKFKTPPWIKAGLCHQLKSKKIRFSFLPAAKKENNTDLSANSEKRQQLLLQFATVLRILYHDEARAGTFFLIAV
jgi:hypothetical protein